MSTSLVLVILTLAGVFWMKVKSYFLDKKVQNEKSEVQEAKDNAAQKVGAATSADNDYEQLLRDYRNKKNDSSSH